MKSYVTLQPGSLTNPSSKHWVVEYRHWMDFSEVRVPMLTPVSTHDDAADAHNAAVELNNREVLG